MGGVQAQQAGNAQGGSGQGRPGPAEGTVALDTIEVQGSSDAAIGYFAPTASTGAKMPVPLRDIPQTVSVVPRQQLNEQNALSLQDALRYTPGVSMAMGDGQRDEVRIRGFSALADQYVDGLRDDSYYYRDPSNIERIEVLQGPASVLYGRGSPGGLVNRITKKPLAEPFNQVGVTLGTAGQRRAEFDLGTKSADDFARFRLTGAIED
jgi:catecholate siderophore receptor